MSVEAIDAPRAFFVLNPTVIRRDRKKAKFDVASLTNFGINESIHFFERAINRLNVQEIYDSTIKKLEDKFFDPSVDYIAFTGDIVFFGVFFAAVCNYVIENTDSGDPGDSSEIKVLIYDQNLGAYLESKLKV